jgi:uncharacterized phage protein (TIGR01671 family)
MEQREIKFRVWSQEYEKLIYFGFKELSNNRGEIEEANIDWLKSQQYTGLKDKKGNEIYEGDIVISENKISLGEDAWEIIFEKGAFMIKRENEYIPLYQIGTKNTILEDDKIKIIGNIYENPELLK